MRLKPCPLLSSPSCISVMVMHVKVVWDASGWWWLVVVDGMAMMVVVDAFGCIVMVIMVVKVCGCGCSGCGHVVIVMVMVVVGCYNCRHHHMSSL